MPPLLERRTICTKYRKSENVEKLNLRWGADGRRGLGQKSIDKKACKKHTVGTRISLAIFYYNYCIKKQGTDKERESKTTRKMGQTENPVPLRSSVFLCSETTRKRLLRRLSASLNSACASNTIWDIQEVFNIFIYLLVYKLRQEAWTTHKARSSTRPRFLLRVCEFHSFKSKWVV